MIYLGRCTICGLDFRVNGEGSYVSMVMAHLNSKHRREMDVAHTRKVLAQKEVDALIAKYPDLELSFGIFSVDEDYFVERKEIEIIDNEYKEVKR